MRLLLALSLLAAYFVGALVAGIVADEDAGRETVPSLLWYLAISLATVGVVWILAIYRSTGQPHVSLIILASVAASGAAWAGWLIGYSASDGYLCAEGDCTEPAIYVLSWIIATAMTAVPAFAVALAIAAIKNRPTRLSS
ncbi:MAG TPA: hypothetical protein VGR43_00645 [Dehalococcoidia bacterium]|nr:hypothetical protein [Dehalococcoidia bacterium]